MPKPTILATEEFLNDEVMVRDKVEEPDSEN